MVSRSTILALAALASTLAGCTTGNTGLESAHQPVVARADYAFDVQTSGYGLAPGESARLAGWMASLGVGYGDRISIDDPNGSGGARSEVASLAAGRGLLIADSAPITTGPVAPGTMRVVVSRATATVPGCTHVVSEYQYTYDSTTSPNHGCSSNSILAAMVANPTDLVRGAPGVETLDPALSSKAIDAYRKAAPTGAGGLKSEGVGK